MIYLYISLFALILLTVINITEHFYFIKKFIIYSVDFETHDIVFLTQNKNMSIVLNINNIESKKFNEKDRCVLIANKYNKQKLAIIFYGNNFHIMNSLF
jgi:hypothetical protein